MGYEIPQNTAASFFPMVKIGYKYFCFDGGWRCLMNSWQRKNLTLHSDVDFVHLAFDLSIFSNYLRFLKDFLKVLETGQVPKVEEDYEPRLVRSACPSLGSHQLELLMPESEVSVMKDVVNANCYAFAPGKASALLRGDVLLDVGAHLGTASALALQTPQVSVIAVEPHPVTFEILTRNLERWQSRATFLKVAIAEKSSEAVDFYTHRGTNNPSRLFFASLFDTRSHSELAITVPSTTLSELISAHEPLGFNVFLLSYY